MNRSKSQLNLKQCIYNCSIRLESQTCSAPRPLPSLCHTAVSTLDPLLSHQEPAFAPFNNQQTIKQLSNLRIDMRKHCSCHQTACKL